DATMPGEQRAAKRDFADLAGRIERLSGTRAHVCVEGFASDYPLYRVDVAGARSADKTVLLTAGVHGDEPAGVEAALAFLESIKEDWLADYHFCVLPCVNPTGYVADTRANSQGIDVNRAFAG